MTIREAAQLQALLEGVSLPAQKQELIEYARRQRGHEGLAGLVERLPDREHGPHGDRPA